MRKNQIKNAAHPLPWPPPALPPFFQATIVNSSQNKQMTCSLKPAQTLSSRMRGLMFRKKCASLLFTFDWTDKHSIHSFFVAFPFDAIYLDEQGKVVDIFCSVPPFSPLLTPRSPVRYLLELEAGSAKKLSARIGDIIVIYATK